MRLKRLALSLLVLLVVVAAVMWRAGAREAAAQAAFPPEGEIVIVDGRKVHAVQMGVGPDLVLIHGSAANARDFTFALAPALAENYRVTVFDRPGLGWSDRLPRGAEGIAEQAAHLKAAADALGVTRPIVLGQSYGGAVALAWALDHPEDIRAVVTLGGPSHPWPGDTPLLYKVTGSTLGSALVVPALTALVPDSYLENAIAGVFVPQTPPEGYSEHFGAALALSRTALRANAAHRLTIKSEIIAMVPRYANFPVPLEILHGTEDKTVFLEVHAEPMIADTSQARLTRLQGIGHTPQHSAMDEVLAAVDRAASRSRSD